jgi:Ser/Thr protein kinase RdoA (MazF antagonist)
MEGRPAVPSLRRVDELLGTWVRQVLGDGCVVRELPVSGRKDAKGQLVRSVVDDRGSTWVLKQVAVAQEWSAEHHAYQHWVPALAGAAPVLRAADPGLRALLVSEVPGSHPSTAHPRTYQQAGSLLRRLHAAAPPRERPASDREAAQQRLHRLLDEAGDLLTRPERAFVRGRGVVLAELPLGTTVPCHGDFRTHNWLVDDAGTLRVIDFGKARWEQPAWDLAKLFLRPWWRRPRLARAFLRGYGRELHPEEEEYVEARMAVDALSHVAFGARRGSPRHVRFGRSRISDLLEGHRVVPT